MSEEFNKKNISQLKALLISRSDDLFSIQKNYFEFVEKTDIKESKKKLFLKRIELLFAYDERVSKDNRRGVLEYSQYNIHKNKIISSVLDWISDFEKNMANSSYEDDGDTIAILEKWNTTLEADSPVSYEDFLLHYPHSSMAAFATMRLVQLTQIRDSLNYDKNLWLECGYSDDYEKLIKYLIDPRAKIFRSEAEEKITSLIFNFEGWEKVVSQLEDKSELSSVKVFITKYKGVRFGERFISELDNLLVSHEQNLWKRINEYDYDNLNEFMRYYRIFNKNTNLSVKASRQINALIKTDKFMSAIDRYNKRVRGFFFMPLFFVNAAYLIGFHLFSIKYLDTYSIAGWKFLIFIVVGILIGLFIMQYYEKQIEKHRSNTDPSIFILPVNFGGDITISKRAILVSIINCAFIFLYFDISVGWKLLGIYFLCLGQVMIFSQKIQENSIVDDLSFFYNNPEEYGKWREYNKRFFKTENNA